MKTTEEALLPVTVATYHKKIEQQKGLCVSGSLQSQHKAATTDHNRVNVEQLQSGLRHYWKTQDE